MIMQMQDLCHELIDLGVASVETQGDGLEPFDIGGLQRVAGIADD
ncbi:benenodin family lasso peptide [Aurantiacibacter xanthus]|uniref:Benenodin family lasso peptide n=1 Tax=Aurantiacibacter xanthus TaxID=1784712 RepID=A0A3A1PG50_9SPHN|nr:benenodin family lasso peptide [Aurantiacibacter xanthus]